MKDADEMLDLFMHPAWRRLMDEMREAHETLVETCYTLETERELWRRKGEIQKLAELLAYEHLFKMNIDESLRSPADDAV